MCIKHLYVCITVCIACGRLLTTKKFFLKFLHLKFVVALYATNLLNVIIQQLFIHNSH